MGGRAKPTPAEPWDRLPAESTPAYEAARTYFEMGADRSLEAVGRGLGKSGTLLSRWSGAHSWVERAECYDAHIRGIEQAAAEKAVAQEAAKWARRQSRQRERDWGMAKALRDKAAEMLRHPLVREVTDEDGLTVIEPARWTMRDAVAMAEAAAKLARLAAEMATDRRQVDWESMPEDELVAIRDGRVAKPR